MNRRRRKFGFTLVELLVVIVIIGILVALVLPAINSVRETGRKLKCTNNLHQIGIALAGYHAQWKSFPSGAAWGSSSNETRMGMHVFLLPFIEEKNRWETLDHDISVYHGINVAQGKQFVDLYRCPSHSDRIYDPFAFKNTWQTTNYVGVMGAGREGYKVNLEDGHCGDYYTDGMFYPYSAVRRSHVRDGLSQTLAMGERVYNLRVWTKGAYYNGSPTKHVCVFSAKNVRWPMNSDSDTFCYLLCTGYNQCVQCPGGRNLLFNDLVFGSHHPGNGAQFVMGDGSVHYLLETIDLTVFQDLATVAGEEDTEIP